MSFRPVRKIVGIGNVFLGSELVDIAEYELEIYEENPRITSVMAPLDARGKKDRRHGGGRVAHPEGSQAFYRRRVLREILFAGQLRSVVISDPMLDSNGKPVA